MKTARPPIAQKLGVRDLAERRQAVDKMYAMILHLEPQHAIIGTGYYIKRVVDERGDYYEVFRRGFGVDRVARAVRVISMFTPEMFCEGIRQPNHA